MSSFINLVDLAQKLYMMNNTLIKDDAFMNEEFELLKDVSKGDAISIPIAQETRNRFEDVLCPVETLVTGEYLEKLHASRIQYTSSTPEAIVTQSPVRASYEQFYEMLLQEETPVVLMLTPICSVEKYWPEDPVDNTPSTMKFINLSVTLEEKPTIKGDLEYRKMKIAKTDKETGEDIEHSFQHVLWEKWEDFTAPVNAEGTIFQLLDLLKDSRAKYPGKCNVIHCRAGVGRTGTLHTIDTICTMIDNNEPYHVADVVRQLRKQRGIGYVQFPEQYRFIYKICSLYEKFKKNLNTFESKITGEKPVKDLLNMSENSAKGKLKLRSGRVNTPYSKDIVCIV